MGPPRNQPMSTKAPPTKQNPNMSSNKQNPPGHVTSSQGHVIYPSEGPKHARVEYLVKYKTSDNTGTLTYKPF